MSPTVSIIIPNYCHAKYLGERMQSILNQTYQDFELIILDDCSQDNGASRSIIEKYRHNPHVSHIVYNEANSGSPFKQWNKGIELAKGDLIWIAESDDTCSPLFLDSLVRAHVEANAVLTFCRSAFVDENGNRLNIKWQMDGVDKDLVFDGKLFFTRFLCYSNEIQNASSAIFNRIEALQIDDEYMNYKGAGDWLFWIELSLRGRVCFVNKELNNYRQHDNTTSSLVKSGLEFHEVKAIYDRLLSEKLITKEILSKCRENNVFVISSIDTIPSTVKKELYKMWNVSNWEMACMFFKRECRAVYLRIKKKIK